jgi:hypothetical protein
MTQEGQSKVYKTQGATAVIAASGGTFKLDGGAANFASGRVTMPPALAKGYLDLSAYLMGARQLASAEQFIPGTSGEIAFWGGVLVGAGGTAGTPALVLTASNDQSLYLNYASAVVVGIKLPPIALPGDLSTAGGLTISLYGETVGSASAADAKDAFDIRAWFDIGDTECGATHPDFTSTPAFKSVTVASGDVTTGILNITLVPEAHAARAIRLYGGKMEYTKRTS